MSEIYTREVAREVVRKYYDKFTKACIQHYRLCSACQKFPTHTCQKMAALVKYRDGMRLLLEE